MKKSKYALNLAPDGRILSATYEEYAPPGAVLMVEMPEGDISQYRFVDGSYVHDPLPEPEPEPAQDPIAQLRAEYDVAFIELAALITGGGM